MGWKEAYLVPFPGPKRSTLRKPGDLQRVRVQVVSLPVAGVTTKLVGRNGQMRGVYDTVGLNGGTGDGDTHVYRLSYVRS